MEYQEKIGRHRFLKQLGFTGASLLALYTLNGCQADDTQVNPISSGDTSTGLDLTKYPALAKSGGYVIWNNVVVANANGSYIAATLICSHEGKKEITFRNGEWYCTAHGARFDTQGKGLNKEGTKGLTIYKTTLSGTILTISA